MKIVFDLEADDLLYGATKIHCGTTQELETGELHHYGPDRIDQLIDVLLEADLLVGHNIAGYDLPLIEKITNEPYLFLKYLDKVRDTYVMSKLLYPTRNSHSLEAWGTKVGISKPEHEDWSVYSKEMEYRNVEDTKINTKVYQYMLKNQCVKYPQWVMSIKLEVMMHYWQAYQEEFGVWFNKERAEALVIHLDNEIAKIDEELDPILPVYCKQVGTTVHKPFKKDGSYAKRVIDWFEPTE
jgi:DNA polymerase-1